MIIGPGNNILRRSLMVFAVACGLFRAPTAVAQPVSPADAAMAGVSLAVSAGLTNLPAAVSTPARDTNASTAGSGAGPGNFKDLLAQARYLETTRQFSKAEAAFLRLLASDVPEEIQRNALFDLGTTVQAENDLPRAEDIFAQYFNRWPDDGQIPEVLLKQGQIFRQMGLNSLALAKFYGVMTAALSIKQNRLDYYQRLVLQAQIEIATTHYQMGQFADAAEYYSRLLKLDDPLLDRTQVQFRLIRSLVAVKRYAEAAGEAQDFIARHPDAPDEPETRYYLAQSLKAQGRNSEALQQVLLFLQEEKSRNRDHPEMLAYWQERVGNEIANQLYNEGDYVNALQVYLNLSRLDSSAAWQLPVDYQVGLSYEHLMQPKKAVEIYQKIIARGPELGTNAAPGLKAMLDMSQWRINFIQWQSQAQTAGRALASSQGTNETSKIFMP
jgi:TolA-binding protein